eukprot:1963673-Pleurochrysis_carterae.AAC.1
MLPETSARRAVTDSYSDPVQSPAAGAGTSREHELGAAACDPCVDLCIASSARALTVTRPARLSDRHVR